MRNAHSELGETALGRVGFTRLWVGLSSDMEQVCGSEEELHSETGGVSIGASHVP